jgi:hypothetical protein
MLALVWIESGRAGGRGSPYGVQRAETNATRAAHMGGIVEALRAAGAFQHR